VTAGAVGLVMAGGEGRRLAGARPGVPKALVRVGGRTLLELTLARLSRGGIEEVYVSLGAHAETIRSALPRLVPPGLRVTALVEEQPRGTIGALAELPMERDERLVLVTNVDLVTAADPAALLGAARAAGADLLVATREELHRLRFGEVLADGDGTLQAYVEKPTKSWRVGAGSLVVGPRARALLVRGQRQDAPQLVQRALQAGLRVCVHPDESPWVDVNDGADLHAAEELVRTHAGLFGTAPASRAWLGLDLGGTKLLGVLVDDDGQVLARARTPTAREEGPAAVLARCADLARELQDAGGPAAGAAAGFAGLVDPRAGRVLSSVILPGFADYPLAAALSGALGLPAWVDNDATLAGVGEFTALGEPRDATLVVLTVGTGIGGALFVGGRLHRGHGGTAGEFGHVTLDWHGEPCDCGSRGCLNTLASGTAIARRALSLAQADPQAALHGRTGPLALQDVARAAEAGDASAARALHDGARALGAAVAAAVNLLDPDRVSLCGGVVELGDSWLSQVRAEAETRALREPMKRVVLARAVHGSESGALGAARLARARASGEPAVAGVEAAW
jgi:glucokinase